MEKLKTFSGPLYSLSWKTINQITKLRDNHIGRVSESSIEQLHMTQDISDYPAPPFRSTSFIFKYKKKAKIAMIIPEPARPYCLTRAS